MLRSIKKTKFIIYGIITAMLLQLPLLLLGDDAIFKYHDQYDGEVLTYVLGAKHIGDNSRAEMFDENTTSSALTIASLGTQLFYYVFEPSTAFVLYNFLIAIVAYIGFVLLMSKLWDLNNQSKLIITIVVAILFSLLDYYSVYGISIMGQPLLAYCCICTILDEKKILSILGIIFFAFNSSLILIGYADIAILLIVSIVLAIMKKKEWKYAFIACATLTVSYCAIYNDILYEMFFSDFVGHKSTYILGASGSFINGIKNFISNFKSMFLNGQEHAYSNHRNILKLLFAVVGLLVLSKNCRNCIDKKDKIIFFILVASVITMSGIYALWRYDLVLKIRMLLGGVFITFQADRFYWLNPSLWYLILAYCIYFISRFMPYKKLSIVVTTIIISIFSINCFNNSKIKINLEHYFNNTDYVGYASFNEFYCEELFDEIDETIGKDKSTYRVCSVGLYPSIALYNGFYCIDGYSNNYALSYKNEFREVIEKELDKSDSLKSYFDGWGNRCYAFCAQIGKRYYINKSDKFELTNLELNYEKMKDLGCEYIFSSCPIKECMELSFIKEFNNEKAPYSVYLYKIN